MNWNLDNIVLIIFMTLAITHCTSWDDCRGKMKMKGANDFYHTWLRQCYLKGEDGEWR